MNNFVVLLFFIPILTAILLLLNVLLAPHNPDEAKVSAYECGYNALHGQTRSIFHIHFYVVAMLFLVFDLEILLLLPIAVSLYQVSIFGFSVAIIFFVVLTIGFILEIGSGAIKISSDSVTTNKNSNLVTPFSSSKGVKIQKSNYSTSAINKSLNYWEAILPLPKGC